jgi:hypothetical protein
MWLACCTQEEIAEAENIDQSTVQEKTKSFMDFGKIAKIHKTQAEYLDDFETPAYNIWTANVKTNAVSHFGNPDNSRCIQEASRSPPGVVNLTTPEN